jgi:hypothetical protein
MQFHTTGIVLAALTAVSAASAQTTQAVEWKVSEGGNGHWYQFVANTALSWDGAKSSAATRCGHLATIANRAENDFIFNYLDSVSAWSGLPGGEQRGPFLGGYQDRNAPDYSEPAGGWRWVTGEPWWAANPWGQPGQEPNNTPSPEDVLVMDKRSGICIWNDANNVNGPRTGYVIEWSADCNADGIVDYGQILRGELIDLNANGVPDICETSVSSVIPPSVPSQGGSTITIRGNGFQANPTVRIGGVPATNVVRVSLTEITATSPALLPGMASVQVNDFTLADGIYIRPDCGSDLDQNGAVDGGDMSILLLDWGPCSNNLQASESQESLK